LSGISGIKDLINHLDDRCEKKKILIIDDDPGYIGLLREWLKTDYKVFMSISGEMALEWLSKNQADLILLDFEMPGLNGPEMLSKIRTLESALDTPVVFITGNEEEEVESGTAAGANGFKPDGCIFKTITRDDFLKTIPTYFR
jgi:CheY-like chemotaxis protein